MNIGPILLINAVFVGAGIFAYDQMKSDPAIEPVSDVTSGYEDSTDSDGAAVPYRPEPSLQGVGDDVLRSKLSTLEAEVASLKAVLAKFQVSGGAIAATGADGSPLASLELPAVAADEADPEFADDTMRSFRALLTKAQALERQERLVDGMKRQLERLGVALSGDQEKAVIDAAVSYRAKQREMWRGLPRGNDEETREKRREAMTTLKEEWSKTVYSLAPSAEAEKIVTGMSRGMGFSSRADTGGGRNNRRGR